MRVFFSPQRKDKDRRRGKLFAIWSINKNANSGKPFLSCDNGGVVIAAPKDSETDGPTHIHNPEIFIFKLKEFLSLTSAAFCIDDMSLYSAMAVTLVAQEQVLD